MGRVEVEVKPSSRRSEVVGYDEWRGRIRIELRSPPEKGKANAELVELLSTVLGVERVDVKIVSGLSSRMKIIEVSSLPSSLIKKRLLESIKRA
ncbi:MAG: YggU family protein [Thermoplasmata archaeon]|nr:YggU family protein [Thermoplasmata archaeon]